MTPVLPDDHSFFQQARPPQPMPQALYPVFFRHFLLFLLISAH